MSEIRVKQYPVWQLTDGTVVIEADEGLSDSSIRRVRSKYLSPWYKLRHRLYKALEAI